jgi:uncharacterized protein
VKELVRFLVEALVDHPEAIELYEVEGDRTTILELKVDPSDVGKVIGRQGKTANALRTLLKAHASRERKRVVLEIIEAKNDESERASSGGEDAE